MEAGKRVINDIFNGNRILEIPFFQRSYIWDEPQWERLLQDVEDVSRRKKPYFLGSIILKQQPTGSHNSIGDVRTVIDGQQRLTTLVIFLKVLCLKNNQAHRFDRIFRLDTNNDIAMTHNHNDIAEFTQISNLKQLITLSGNTKIIEAYNYFNHNVNTQKIDLQAILSNIMFVGIDINEKEDEQQIFDTINSLGVRLTTGELLKNYFFDRNSLDSYNKNWKDVFEKDNDCREYWDKGVTAGRVKRTNLELFFYSFLQIKLQDSQLNVKANDKKEYGRFEGLFNSYKAFISKYKIPKNQVIDEIREYAKIYQNNIDLDILNMELPAEAGIERMNAIIFGLENSTLIPYVLYVLKESNSVERNNIFSYLESYIMRRIVCRSVNKNYNNLFSESLISNNVITETALKAYISQQADKANYMPDNNDLKEAFLNSRLINKQSAGILYMLESKIRNHKFQSTALLGINGYSLEHLMPKKWENRWGKLSDTNAIAERNKVLLTLGNLAIITASLNSSIRDADWATKKAGDGQRPGLSAYSSGIETLYPWLNRDNWDESTIIERAEDLYSRAIQIWP